MTAIEEQFGCKTCGPPLDCTDPNPLDVYTLEGPRFGFVLNCPPGQNCGNANQIIFECCGQFIVATFPPGATASQRTTIISDAVEKCRIANLFCGGDVSPVVTPPGSPPPPPTILFSSRAQIRNLECSGGGTFHYVLRAGSFVAATQAAADQLAIDFANENSAADQFCVVVPGLCPCVGQNASYAAKVIGGTPSFSAAATSGHYPDGMTLITSGRNILFRGSAETPGYYRFTLNVTDRNGAYWDGTVNLHALLVGYSTLTSGTYTLPAVNASDTVDFVDVSDLEVGDVVTLARLNGGVVVDESGDLEVTNIAGNTVTLKNLTGTPGNIFPSGSGAAWPLTELPNYTQNTPYSFQLPATGGSGSYSWGITTGTLPDGLDLSITGLISGTPTGTGSFNFTVALTDNACETADRSFFRPIVRMTAVSTATTAVVRGFDEFGTPSSPPKKYMIRTYTGSIAGNDASGRLALTGEAMSVMMICNPATGNPAGPVAIPTYGVDYVPLATAHAIFSGADQINAQGQQISTAVIQGFSSCANATPVVASTSFAPGSSMNFVMPGWCYKYNLAHSFSELPDPTFPVCTTPAYPLVVDPSFQPINTSAIPYPLFGSIPTTTSTTHQENTSSGSFSLGFIGASGPPDAVPLFPPNLGQYLETDGAFPSLNGVAFLVYKHNYSIDLSSEYTDAIALAHAHVVTSNGTTAVNKPRTTGFVSYFTTVSFTLKFSNLVFGEEYTASVQFVDQSFAVTTQTYNFTASGTTHTITDSVPTPTSGGTRRVQNPTIIFTPE